MKIKYDPSFWGKRLIRRSYWETSNDKVLLTFDDGPIPETTPLILDKLKELHLKGLFLCVGENIKKYPNLAQEILAQGHLIGNHTFNHANLLTLKRKEQTEQVTRFDEIYKKKNGGEVKYFRPPKGRIPLGYASLLNGKKNVMWSLLTYDYKNDINIVKFAVRKYLKQNSIVVLHDSLKSKDIIVEAIQFIYEEAGRKGYLFGVPSECLK